MHVFRTYLHLPEAVRGCVVALGNFDGVHRGHRAVVAAAAAEAERLRAPLTVLTFEPHPRAVFRPGEPPFRLTPFRIRERHIEALGVETLIVAHFDAQFRHRTAENFVTEVLMDGLAVRHVVGGVDFRFGLGRQGDMALLTTLGGQRGFGVTAVPPLLDQDGQVFSSSRARRALRAGNPEEAAHVLGRPWEIEGRVESGDRRGRLLGFPTANVALGEYLHPRYGAYVIRAGVDHGASTVWRGGVANIGERPSVGGTVARLEAHLFDFADDLYGCHLRVQLLSFLRPEQRFASLDALKAQIAQDAAQARERLAASDPE